MNIAAFEISITSHDIYLPKKNKILKRLIYIYYDIEETPNNQRLSGMDIIVLIIVNLRIHFLELNWSKIYNNIKIEAALFITIPPNFLYVYMIRIE